MNLIRLSPTPKRSFVSRIFAVDILGVNAYIQDQSDPGSVHFFPTLFSAIDVSIGITSEFVIQRIIKVRHHPELRAFRYL